LLLAFIFCLIAILVVAVSIRLLRIDKRERGEGGDGYWGGGGGGGDDKPELPPSPRGGPIDAGDFKIWELEFEEVRPRTIEVVVIRQVPEPEEEAGP
jgi:hypothetical protein